MCRVSRLCSPLRCAARPTRVFSQAHLGRIRPISYAFCFYVHCSHSTHLPPHGIAPDTLISLSPPPHPHALIADAWLVPVCVLIQVCTIPLNPHTDSHSNPFRFSYFTQGWRKHIIHPQLVSTHQHTSAGIHIYSWPPPHCQPTARSRHIRIPASVLHLSCSRS